MNLKIIIRYSLLINLMMLLWLALEYMVGLHDKYVTYHPYLSLLAFIIPAYGIHKAIKDIQEDEPHQIPLRRAFMIGFVVTLFSALLSIPVQLIFHELINPDFFQNMINFAVKRAVELNHDPEKAKRQAEMYFNLPSYLLQSVLGTLISGCVISIIVAWLKSRNHRRIGNS